MKSFGKKTRLFTIVNYDNQGWARLFTGHGLAWRHNKNPPLWIERYGYTKTIKIGNYHFHYLKP